MRSPFVLQIEELSTFLRSFHAMPPPVLCFPFDATTSTEEEKPSVPATVPQTLGRAASDSAMKEVQGDGRLRPETVASRATEPVAVPQMTATTEKKT